MPVPADSTPPRTPSLFGLRHWLGACFGKSDGASDTLVTADTADPTPVDRRAQMLGLLRRPEGASVAEIVAVTGWQPHSARAALSGLRKRRVKVERLIGEGRASRYRIMAGAQGNAGEGDPLRQSAPLSQSEACLIMATSTPDVTSGEEG